MLVHILLMLSIFINIASIWYAIEMTRNRAYWRKAWSLKNEEYEKVKGGLESGS